MYDRWRLRSAAVVVAVVGLLAGACGSKGNDADAPTETPLETTASTDAAGIANVTPPGKVLRYGQPAFVPIQVEGRSGVIAVTIDKVAAGLPQDAAALQVAGGTPYYVTMTIQNTGAPPDLGSYEPDLFAVQDDGAQALSVNEPDDFPPCRDNGPEKLALGAHFTTCEVYLPSADHLVRSVEYVDSPGSKPITWH
ncbi:MAG TPA: hypothetical protein VKB57_21860 [Acidimicrobiales bacterium]|nr:hypothetical protein [Acidimicrobiales bacterium]